MTFEMQSEQIFDFTFMPVEGRTVEKVDNRWHGRYRRIEVQLDVDPRRVGILVEGVEQRPTGRRRLLDDECGKCKIEVPREPLAEVAQVSGSAFDPTSASGFVKRRDNLSLPPATTKLREARRARCVIVDAIDHGHRVRLASHRARRRFEQVIERRRDIDADDDQRNGGERQRHLA